MIIINSGQIIVHIAIHKTIFRINVMIHDCINTSFSYSFDLRGEPFTKDPTFDWSGRLRQNDNQVESFGFSNKARQIEQDLGASP